VVIACTHRHPLIIDRICRLPGKKFFFRLEMDLYFAEHGVRPGSAASRGSGVLSEGVAATLQAAAMMAQLAEAGDGDSDEMQRLRTAAQRMLTSLLESDPSVQGHRRARTRQCRAPIC
jgi:hypothetical protein